MREKAVAPAPRGAWRAVRLAAARPPAVRRLNICQGETHRADDVPVKSSLRCESNSFAHLDETAGGATTCEGPALKYSLPGAPACTSGTVSAFAKITSSGRGPGAPAGAAGKAAAGISTRIGGRVGSPSGSAGGSGNRDWPECSDSTAFTEVWKKTSAAGRGAMRRARG